MPNHLTEKESGQMTDSEFCGTEEKKEECK